MLQFEAWWSESLSHFPGANEHTACYHLITRQLRFKYQRWNKIIKCLQTQINLHSLTFWEWNDKCHKRGQICTLLELSNNTPAGPKQGLWDWYCTHLWTKWSRTWILTNFKAQRYGPMAPTFQTSKKVVPMSLAKKLNRCKTEWLHRNVYCHDFGSLVQWLSIISFHPYLPTSSQPIGVGVGGQHKFYVILHVIILLGINKCDMFIMFHINCTCTPMLLI